MIRQNKASVPNTFQVYDDEQSSALVDRNESAGVVSSSRRTPTPSKHIPLQHVKRRDDRNISEEKIDLDEIRQSLSRENSEVLLTDSKAEKQTTEPQGKRHKCEVEKPNTKPPFAVRASSGIKPLPAHGKLPPERDDRKEKINKKPSPEKERGKERSSQQNVEEKKEDKEESSSSDSDDDGEEERKAPTQLMMEFLQCLMFKDYTNASKLCKMILIYEPNHAEALKFQPIIEERLVLDQEAEDDSDESEDDDDDDDEDSDDDEDDEDEDSGNSDSDSAEDEEEENEGHKDESSDESKIDSGIVSANSDG